MIVLMNLLEKNDEYVIYSYGYEENNLDGRIKIYLNNSYNYEIIRESKDEHISKATTLKAVSKLMKAAKNDVLKKEMSYQC
ncbi:hypothetical protein JY742_18205 [Clostridioides difficile]|nr:hypothetical protein [Clostridioides difficile]